MKINFSFIILKLIKSIILMKNKLLFKLNKKY